MQKAINDSFLSFKDYLESNPYCVDKTLFIKELFSLGTNTYQTPIAKVMIITRPQGFGKTFNLLMLKDFFDLNTSSQEIFVKFKIRDYPLIVKKYLNQYPVVLMSLKELDGTNLDDLNIKINTLFKEVLGEFNFLLESNKVSYLYKKYFTKLIENSLKLNELKFFLLFLTQALEQHYQKKVIVLIDDYDAPLAQAYKVSATFYQECLDFFNFFYADAFKANFALLTGNLPLTFVRQFTGFDNFKHFTIRDKKFEDCFGFTQTELVHLLKTYDLGEKLAELSFWYDGFCVGDLAHLYCPQDVINYLQTRLIKSKTMAHPYYVEEKEILTLKDLLNLQNIKFKNLCFKLLKDTAFEVEFLRTLHYAELGESRRNLLNFLYFKGYLTSTTSLDEKNLKLKLSNEKVKALLKSVL